ncbi:MAG: ABC transporter permease [Candidatus Omnitrophota bacterium]
MGINKAFGPSSLAPALWRSRPRLFNNPVILRELVAHLRKKSSFLYLFLFLAFGALIFLFLFFDMNRSGAIYAPGKEIRIRQFFLVFSIAEGAFISLLVPLISGSAFNLERERDTWDLLRSTPINASSLFMGKFLSSMLFVWLLFLSHAAFYGLFFFLGAVSPKEVVVLFLLLSEAAIIMALIGLCCSLFWKRPLESIAAAYFIGFFYFAVMPFIREGMYNARHCPEMAASPVVLVVEYLLAVPQFNELSPWLRSHLTAVHAAWAFGLIVFLFLLGVTLIRRSTEPRPSRWSKIAFWRHLQRPIFTSKKSVPMILFSDKNPIIHKELRPLRRSVFKRIRTTLFYFFLGLCWIEIGIELKLKNAWCSSLFLWTLLVPFLSIPYAAYGIRGEKDKNTWDLLRTTTLSSTKILQGKTRSGWFLFHWKFWSAAALLYLIGLCSLIFENSHSPSNMVLATYWIVSIIVSYVSAALYSAFALYCSAAMRKTISAYAVSFFLAIGLVIGPYLLLIFYAIMMGNDRDIVVISAYISPLFLIGTHKGFKTIPDASWLPAFLFQTIWMLAASRFLYSRTLKNLNKAEE